jgi:hypothetical protein
MTLSLLLHPERAHRLIGQKALDNKQMGLDGMLQQLTKATLFTTIKDAYKKEIQNTINYNVVKHILNLAFHKKSTPQVSALAKAHLKEIKSKLSKQADVHALEMMRQIDAALAKPESFKALPSPQIPDGSPIGCFQE